MYFVTFINGSEAFPHPVAAAPEFYPYSAVGGGQDVRKFVSAESACSARTRTRIPFCFHESPQFLIVARVCVCVCCKALTQQRSFPPVAVAHLHVVVPTQAALVQVHGGEVEHDLRSSEIEEEKCSFLFALPKPYF